MIGSDFLNAAIFAENLSASATAMGGAPATQLGDPERSWSSIATPFGGLTSKAISSTRPWLQAEIFGIAPDPTVVATLGVLMAADRTHWELLVVPLLWCAISGGTLWAMQSSDALLAPAAALLALVLACWKTLSRLRQASPA